jgi:hypothetical protein
MNEVYSGLVNYDWTNKLWKRVSVELASFGTYAEASFELNQLIFENS